MTTIPIINMEFGELKEVVWNKLKEPHAQRRLILVIVSIALLLDNMLYMVIVPIIPDYLRYIGAYVDEPIETIGNTTLSPDAVMKRSHHGQDSATGILFASKAIVQLMVNPFSGALIDRIGYDLPMMVGLTIMFLSTAVFACGRSYGLLFFARSLQGVGSAFADTSGLAMIADRFTEENERSKALGIALAFISFGCLVAPPFGGALYQFAGKEVPFLILAFVSLIDGFMLLLVMKPIKEQIKDSQREKPPGIPIWRLFIDPYIAVCSGALMMSNVALAFLEPTISLWMEDNLTTDNWKIGMIWLPAFFPHVFGVILTVKMARKYPQYQWLMAAGGLALEGLCCFIIPFSSSYKVLMIPICGICFGIALIDTALLPTLGYLVDVRYVSVYGSIYAIADISYSVAYAVGPIIAGGVVEAIGFTALNVGIAFSNLLYAPVLIYLRHIYDFKPFENEANVLMSDPPDKEYQTYTLQDQKAVATEVKNHLEYSQYQENRGMQETNIDNVDQNGYGNQYQGSYQNQSDYNQQQGYQQQGHQQQGYQQQGNYQQDQGYQYQDAQQQRPQSARQLPQQPQDANPFRRPEVSAQAPPASQPSTGSRNPFRQGWKGSILSLPKKWLSSTNIPYNKSSIPDDQDLSASLPKLPVPKLEHTMERYLDTMKPLLTNEQHRKLTQLVEDFAGPNGLGHKLQLYLEDRREKTDNWAYDYWLKDMYFNVPLPLPVNSNPGMVFPPRRFTTVLDVARFAARMLDATLDYKEMTDRRGVPQECATSREKGQPLCMIQYYRILTSYRMPGRKYDKHITTNNLAPGSKTAQHDEHVIVACRNQFYCVPVKAADRGRLTEDEICAQLLLILDDAPCLVNSPPVGLLTGSGRRHWAESREALACDEKNRRNLDLIERSLLIVCFDEALPPSFNSRCNRSAPGHIAGERDETNMFLQMLHGGGSTYNSSNRWFDKTVQLIISNDGACGLCYEHSVAEGVAVIQLMEKLLAHADAQPAKTVVPISTSHLPPPERLEWTIETENCKHIQEAAEVIDRLIKDLDFQVFRFSTYGKDFIKSVGVSPDAFIQLALQLAYYRLYNRLCSTYESASTRRFRHGRVDCIRSASPEALDWAIVMAQAEPAGVPTQDAKEDQMDSGKKDQQKYSLFQAAVKKQTEIMVENIMGHGIDIHLLGLREAAKDTSPTAAHPLPKIFTDESYSIANAFLLSTSQVATTGDSFMGYGAVVPDGYGASYNPKKDQIVFCLAAFNSSDITSVSKFAQSLDESLNAMHSLLSRVKAK